MANHKSAEKRIRSSKKRAQINKRLLTSLRKCEKSLNKSIESKQSEDLEKGLKKLFKLADRAKSKGVIKKNTANRKKSRFSIKVKTAQKSQ